MGFTSQIKSTIKRTAIYRSTLESPFYRELRIFFSERSRFLNEAKRRFSDEHPAHGSYPDYKKAQWKHRVTYSEYMFSYEYWKLDEKQRDEFVSTSEMQCIYRKLGDSEVREIFHDKTKFLKLFGKYVYRKWALAKDLSLDEFKEMIIASDCIAKPIDGTRGDGIFKVSASEVNDWTSLWNECKSKNVLLEECIQECDELASFHPSSLNTIRVVTISNKGKCAVFGALFRMGAHGSIIDNTHAGGIYAPINIETGTIDIAAIDSHNNHYDSHPDTQKPIKGYRIPHWEEIVNTCKEATQTIPNIRFAGWDVCVNRAGHVEIIEGNHAPDFDGGMQAPLKVGVKKKVADTIKSIMNIDMLPLIKVYNNNPKI